MTALLEAERLHLRHGASERDALRDVSLAVGAGEILVLAGPNGSGKSSLLAALGREIAPRAGVVKLGGEDVRRISRRTFARRVARLPQEPACPEGLTVEALVRHGRHPHVGFLSAHGAGDRHSVHAALAAMDLLDLRSRDVASLSGGERRRSWLAMVLAQGSEILLLDEPTASLDLRHQWQVLELLARASRERGTTLVLSLHDLEQAALFAHRVAILHRGRLYDLGPPEHCLAEEMLRDVFGVAARVSKLDGAIRIQVRGPGNPLRSL